jgi:hypothetical protein
MTQCQYPIDGQLASEIGRQIVAEQAAIGGSAANMPEGLARFTPLVLVGLASGSHCELQRRSVRHGITDTTQIVDRQPYLPGSEHRG